MPKVVDLFAGAGGFSLGAELAGYEVEHSIELDRWACDTIELNHPGARVTCADITTLDKAWIRREIDPYPDLLIGGPPCQGFSHAGPVRKDPKDPRNSLFRDFIRFAEILQPAAVVIENVPGLLRSRTADGRPVADVIHDELARIGYRTACLVLEAERYGVPQLRRRVFFIGTSDGNPPGFIPETHRVGPVSILNPDLPDALTVRDAIADLPLVDVGWTSPTCDYVGPPTNEFQQKMRRNGPTEIENHLPMRHRKSMVERFALIAPGQSQADVPDEDRRRTMIRSNTAINAYDQNNRRMHWDRPCHTLAASFYANFLHPELNRNFTPREGARIQTFPDRYIFCGKPTVISQKLLSREGRTDEKHLCQYVQIGNAVPPALAEALLQQLRSASEPTPKREQVAVGS